MKTQHIRIKPQPTVLAFSKDEWAEIAIMLDILLKNKSIKALKPIDGFVLKIQYLIAQEILHKVQQKPLCSYPFTSAGKLKQISLKLTELQEFVFGIMLLNQSWQNPLHQTLGLVIINYVHQKEINQRKY